MRRTHDEEYEIDSFEYGGACYNVTLYNIQYGYSPAERGLRDSMGVPLEPDYPAEVEFICAEADIERVSKPVNHGCDLTTCLINPNDNDMADEYYDVYHAVVREYAIAIENWILNG